MKPSIIRLRALEKQLYAYLYAMTVIDFDAETVAPEGSADGRAEATEVLSRASFDLLVNDGTAALLKEAAADAETEQERVSKRHTPAVRTLPSRPQPHPSCHYLTSCSTASRNLAHSPARYSALSPFPSLVSSIGSPTYSLSLFPNSL